MKDCWRVVAVAAWWTGAVWLTGGAAVAQQAVTVADAAAYRVPAMPEAVWSPDSGRFAYQHEEALWLYDSRRRQAEQLIAWKTVEEQAMAAPAPEAFAWVNRGVKEQAVQWLPAGDRLLLAARGDLFLLTVAGRQVRQLTRTAVVEADAKVSPDGRWVAFRREHDLYTLELDTGKTVRVTQGGTALVRNGELDWVYPEELGLSTAYWWSPDSRQLAYLQFNLTGVMSYPHVDLTGLRPVLEPQRFPAAGTPNPVVRLGVVSRGGGKTRWLVETGADELLARVQWLPGGAALAALRLNRVQNRLEVASVDVTTGRATTVLEETSRWWVNVKDDFRFVNRDTLVWGSERSGYRHLYAGSAPALRAATAGAWEVTELACVDAAGQRLYYLSTEPSPLERQLWVVNFDGSGKQRLSREKGTHGATFAPDCSRYAATHSSLELPPRFSVHLASGEQEAELVPRDKEIVTNYRLLGAEVAPVTTRDGETLYGKLIKPAGFVAGKKYPAVVLVYGGPHAQRVTDKWTGLDWEQALAHKGFVVWLLDNRGSAFRGQEWEARLYRRLGKQELSDQLEGLDYLVGRGFVDARRVGIYGWSYGGFMTLYSLLNAPERFRAGIAGAPVTDWRQYDTIYTERYLGLPGDNEEGYRASSPVWSAEKLQSALLLVHNFEDDNVLFQHTFRMMEALQKANKPFSVMLYPQKAHAVTGALRRHLLETMTAFFERELRGE
jgi:dipeptidyl-peptidase-4